MYNSPIRNNKLIQEAYEAGRRQALWEQAGDTPGGESKPAQFRTLQDISTEGEKGPHITPWPVPENTIPQWWCDMNPGVCTAENWVEAYLAFQAWLQPSLRGRLPRTRRAPPNL